MTSPPILLASASPRRSELLRQVGIAHEVRPVALDESAHPGEAPAAYVLRLARGQGARAVGATRRRTSDGPCSRPTRRWRSKARSSASPPMRPNPARCCERLSGRTHEVHTAVALVHATASAPPRVSSSDVSFRDAHRGRDSTGTGAPASPPTRPAATRCRAAPPIFIRHIAGSYSGVMGLPLFETWELLAPVLGPTPRGAAA